MTAPRADASRRDAAVLGGLGAVGIVGSMLPWIRVTGSGAETITTFLEAAGIGFGGLDRNGAATIVAFVAVVGLAVARALGRLPRAAPIAAAVAGLGSVAATLAVRPEIADLADRYRDTLGTDTLHATPAVGWWVTLVAALALAGAGLGLAVRARRGSI